MDQPKLGQLITEPVGRDCCHIAIAPVVASETLGPGQRIGCSDGVAYSKDSCGLMPLIGIVDPFLTRLVQKGERFYLFLDPGTITGMRHVWTHHAFKSKVPSLKEDQ